MTTDEPVFSRRSFLAGTTATVAGTGASGCLGSSGSGGAVDVAYMPIFPDLQYFVMESQGYFDEIDEEINAREFSDGTDIVRAYGGGEVDIGLFGIVPAMIAINRGIPIKVTAANIREPNAVMVHDDLAEMWDENGTAAETFDAWEREKDSKFRFGTFPQGSTPDVLLRFWLRDVGVEPGEDVRITEIGGANALRQAIAGSEVDGASVLEPVLTRAQQESSMSLFRTAGEIMPGQPGAVVAMSDEVRGTETARQFLRQHIRATEFINENPDETAEIVEEGIGMPVEQARQALDGPLANFITDPREIVDGTAVFSEFTHENGGMDEELSSDQIFDHTIYEGL